MKTLLIVSSVVAALACAPAMAQDRKVLPDPAYNALAPDSGSPAPFRTRLHRDDICGPDRASPLWGADGHFSGYECLGGANGS